MLSISTASAYAEFIKDSYFVGFKKEASIIDPPNKANRGLVPFGEHSSGQSKEALAVRLNLNGRLMSIYDTISAVRINMSAEEAHRLSLDKRVAYVQQERLAKAFVQNSPGWGLDRLDDLIPGQDLTYNDTPMNGAGRTIYILDSGLNLGNATVAAEFTDPLGNSRASVIWDVNGGTGTDCLGHGTQVASAAAGNTYGAAKGATIIAAKVTLNCTNSTSLSGSIDAINWLATNAPAGTIVNWSHGLSGTSCNSQVYSTPLEAAIINAHNNGIIVVVAAGNDGCDTADYSPTNIPEAFVVSATSSNRFALQEDERTWFSRFGANISTFAPGETVRVLNFDGTQVTVSGTSFAAPYIAGLFATGCQAAAPFCDNITSAAQAYQALRDTGTLGTVVNTGGGALPAGTTSRFIWKQW